MGPIWQAQFGASLVMLIGPSSTPNCITILAPNLGPLGKEDVGPNFALTATKFVFSSLDNFRAKANSPKPRYCPIRALNGATFQCYVVPVGRAHDSKTYRLSHRRSCTSNRNNYMN